MDITMSDEVIENLTLKHYEKILKKEYSFSKPVYKKTTLTQQSENGKKKRDVYSLDRNSTEYVICEYLKMKLDSSFQIKYSDRKKIIKILLNTLPALKDLNDFTLIRFDFKSFFNSVSTNFIMTHFIESSSINRRDKELFADFCREFPFCFAGLQTSNAMTEIACEQFDRIFKSKLSDYGVVYCERYVDDVLIILNKYITKSDFEILLNECINLVFIDCKVKINERKFCYISKRDMNLKNSFDFLGYDFTLLKTQEGTTKFEFGITKSKINKYQAKIRQSLSEYNNDQNLELLRHRMKLFSIRIVYSMDLNDGYCHWVTKGLINNYNELRFHLDSLDKKTKRFLQYAFYDEMRKNGVSCPYYMLKEFDENNQSIYNIYSNLKRNRSMVFDEKIGVSFKTLVCEMRKIQPSYYSGTKVYYQVVQDYLDCLGI